MKSNKANFVIRPNIALSTQREIKDLLKINHFITESAERRCSSEGQWESRFGEPDPVGWTNFTPCFRPEVSRLLKKIYAGGNDDVGKVKSNSAYEQAECVKIMFNL